MRNWRFLLVFALGVAPACADERAPVVAGQREVCGNSVPLRFLGPDGRPRIPMLRDADRARILSDPRIEAPDGFRVETLELALTRIDDGYAIVGRFAIQPGGGTRGRCNVYVQFQAAEGRPTMVFPLVVYPTAAALVRERGADLAGLAAFGLMLFSVLARWAQLGFTAAFQRGSPRGVMGGLVWTLAAWSVARWTLPPLSRFLHALFGVGPAAGLGGLAAFNAGFAVCVWLAASRRTSALDPAFALVLQAAAAATPWVAPRLAASISDEVGHVLLGLMATAPGLLWMLSRAESSDLASAAPPPPDAAVDPRRLGAALELLQVPAGTPRAIQVALFAAHEDAFAGRLGDAEYRLGALHEEIARLPEDARPALSAAAHVVHGIALESVERPAPALAAYGRALEARSGHEHARRAVERIKAGMV